MRSSTKVKRPTPNVQHQLKLLLDKVARLCGAKAAFISTTNMTRWPLSEINIMNKGEGFTYALLTRSEEKGRDLLEAGVYAVFALSALLAICQFVAEARPMPTNQGISIHHWFPKHHIAVQHRAM
jgi:hypothetical protein